MLKEQGGKCFLCRQPIVFNGKTSQGSAMIDHCHKSMVVRGILCIHCNTILGRIENTIPLDRLIEYLQQR
jgi:hypothetical protein